MPVVDLLRRFAEKKNATPAQIALAWLLAQKPWIVPIPGTRNLDHLNENLGAINVQLTAEDLSEIRDTGFCAFLTLHVPTTLPAHCIDGIFLQDTVDRGAAKGHKR